LIFSGRIIHRQSNPAVRLFRGKGRYAGGQNNMSEFDHRPPRPPTGGGYFEAQAEPPTRVEPSLPVGDPGQSTRSNFGTEVESLQHLHGAELLMKATDLALHSLSIREPRTAEHILKSARGLFELENRERSRELSARRNSLLKQIWGVAAAALLVMGVAGYTLFRSTGILLPIGLVCFSAGLLGTLLVHFDFLDGAKLQQRDNTPALPETIFR